MKYMKINFRKVKSHSNDKCNDEADRLAKIGSGIFKQTLRLNFKFFYFTQN